MGKALYRKYRSKSLGDIFGQGHVTNVLERALKQGKIAHAYLLTGPRGVGKTSIARILAHEINQLPYTDTSQHLDIIEIDAASNNGVEDIRDLRDKVQIAPISASKKIYIIDEVHMLSKAAFNALLKTLEEPPEHVVFILATTDADKLPATIISRTQRFSLKAISLEDIEKHLAHIAKEEKLKIDEAAIKLIAKRGDGSFRDSISLLDQLSSVAGTDEPITLGLVEEALGLAPAEQVKKLLEAHEAKDLAAVVSLLNESEAAGVQPGVLTDQLLHEIRVGLFDKPQLLPLMDSLLEVPKSSQPSIKLLTVLAQHDGKPRNAALSAPVASVSASVEELRASSSSRSLSTSQKHATLLQDNLEEKSLYSAELPKGQTALNSQDSSSKFSGQASSVSLEVDNSALQMSSRSTSGFKETKSEEQPNDPPAETEGSLARNGLLETRSRKGDLDQTITEIDWPKLVEYTRQHHVAIYSVISKCSHAVIDGGLTIYTGNAFYKKKLDDTKYSVSLGEALAKIGVEDVAVTTIPTPPPPKDGVAASVAAIMGGGEEVSVGADATS